MTDTNLDWADEIAARVYLPDLMDASQLIAMRGSQGAIEAATRNKIEATKQQRHEISSALRAAFLRGRIAELRAAAVIARKHGETHGLDTDKNLALAHFAASIENAADKLEKGEA